MRSPSLAILSLSLLALNISCDDDDKDGMTASTTSTTTTTTDGSSSGDDNTCSGDSDCDNDYTCANGSCVYDPSVWVIGEGGTVLRVTALGSVSPHDFAESADLRAITCHGRDDAWVVGEDGFVARTADGGDHWQRVELDVSADLLAVEATADHQVWIAGAEGTLIRSDLGGLEPVIVGGASGILAGLGVSGDAGLVVVAGDDGSVWRGDGAGVSLATTLPVRLRGAFVTPAGDRAAVVGDGGMLAISSDSGLEWDVAPAGGADLHAVQIASDGSLVLAVGDAGEVVRVDGDELSVSVVDERDLRALHIDAAGQGAIVGRDGAFLLTDDAGHSFSTIEVGSSADLLGVDALGHVHL